MSLVFKNGRFWPFLGDQFLKKSDRTSSRHADESRFQKWQILAILGDQFLKKSDRTCWRYADESRFQKWKILAIFG